MSPSSPNRESVSEPTTTRSAPPQSLRPKSVLFPGFKKLGKKEVCTSITIPGKGKVATGFEDLFDEGDFSAEGGSSVLTIEARQRSFRKDTIGGPEKYLDLPKKLIFKTKKTSSCCVLF